MNKNDKVTIHPDSQFAGFYERVPDPTETYLKERREELAAAIADYQSHVYEAIVAIRDHRTRQWRRAGKTKPTIYPDSGQKLHRDLELKRGTLTDLDVRFDEINQVISWLDNQKSEEN